jgi:hypothetical protein
MDKMVKKYSVITRKRKSRRLTIPQNGTQSETARKKSVKS